MYAVIKSGGKQHRVKAGQVVRLEKIEAETGSNIDYEEVLMVDDGDNVIVINADKVRLTGNKRDGDIFYWHTGYPGGIKQRTKGQILDGKHPERVVEKAVQRMLPKGPLGYQVFKNLRVYAGTEHPHEAQKPEVLDVAAMNPKNKR